MSCLWCKMIVTRYALRSIFRRKHVASHRLCWFCERNSARKVIRECCGSPAVWAYDALFDEEQK